jgi:hypothetical protein
LISFFAYSLCFLFFKLENRNSSNAEALSKDQQFEDKFTKAIILADCKLFLAILTFLRQEATAYLSSGLLQIRRSWKMYARIQKQLYDLYKKMEPNAEQIYGSDPNSNVIQLLIDDNDDSEVAADIDNENSKTAKETKKNNSTNNLAEAQNDSSAQLSQAINELTVTDDETIQGVNLETVKRLLGAVSYGYGLFQICLSFVPPNILKLIKLFGKIAKKDRLHITI